MKGPFYYILPLFMGCVLLSGCGSNTEDPMQQTISTDSEQWQDELGETLNQLSESDRELLNRYMTRMRSSESYEKGAMPRTTIKQAIEQQREYEDLHPQSPTGPINQNLNNTEQNNFSFALLPSKTSENDSLTNVKLRFVLANRGDVAISSFKGTLLLKDATFDKPKPVVIPLTQFDPAIAPNGTGNIDVDVTLSDPKVSKAISTNKEIEIEVSEGRMTFENGDDIDFE